VFFVVVGGEKVTLIVHVPSAPGTRVVVPVVLQVPVVSAKSVPLIDGAFKMRLVRPEFLTVIVLVAVAGGVTVPKLRLLGLSEMSGSRTLPVNPTDCGLKLALSVMTSEA